MGVSIAEIIMKKDCSQDHNRDQQVFRIKGAETP